MDSRVNGRNFEQVQDPEQMLRSHIREWFEAGHQGLKLSPVEAEQISQEAIHEIASDFAPGAIIFRIDTSPIDQPEPTGKKPPLFVELHHHRSLGGILYELYSVTKSRYIKKPERVQISVSLENEVHHLLLGQNYKYYCAHNLDEDEINCAIPHFTKAR